MDYLNPFLTDYIGLCIALQNNTPAHNVTVYLYCIFSLGKINKKEMTRY